MTVYRQCADYSSLYGVLGLYQMIVQEVEIEINAPVEKVMERLSKIGHWPTRFQYEKDAFAKLDYIGRLRLKFSPYLKAKRTKKGFEFFLARSNFFTGRAIMYATVHSGKQRWSKILGKVRPTVGSLFMVSIQLLATVYFSMLMWWGVWSIWPVVLLFLSLLALELKRYHSSQRLLIRLLTEHTQSFCDE